jgi:hypothetical protein
MKQFYLLLALFCASHSFAQNSKKQNAAFRNVEYTNVVTLDSFPASQLYFNAKLFLTSAFHSARESAQIKDDKTQTVATKGSFPVVIQNADGENIKAKTFFTLIIQVKQGMYKYMLNDFYFAYTEETGITTYASFNDRMGVFMNKKQWQAVEEQTEEFVKSFVDDLKGHMVQTDILCKDMLTATKKKN